MYSVEVTPRAARQIKKLPPEARGQILEAIEGLADDPRPHGCKKLQGVPDLYRIAVAHDYRVVYQVGDAVILVVIVKTGHRREVYERLDEIRAILQGICPASDSAAQGAFTDAPPTPEQAQVPSPGNRCSGRLADALPTSEQARRSPASRQ